MPLFLPKIYFAQSSIHVYAAKVRRQLNISIQSLLFKLTQTELMF